MRLSDINPFVRFASTIVSGGNVEATGVYDCRIFYICEGSITVSIESQNLTLEKNNLFYCAAGSKYLITAQNSATIDVLNFDLTNDYKHIRNSIAPVSVKDFDIKKALLAKPIENSDFLNSYTVVTDAEYLHNKLRKIIEEFLGHKIYYREKASGILKEILVQMHREITHSASTPGDACNKVIEYIKENYENKMLNSSLSKLTGYHEYYLNNLFIKHTGMNLHRYIIMFRLNKAKNLLTGTDLPINIIAEKTGFSNPSHFSYTFKKEFSTSPTDYKKNFKL